MNEEQIIKIMKEIQEDYGNPDPFKDDSYYDKAVAIEGLLDLYYKQQKEIERLKFDSHMVGKWNEYLDKECVSKGKIREIFQFYIERDSLFTDDTHKMAVIRLKDVLQELLEEN